jgi:acyl-CoA synthetase (AMP-forming)/AMP-acid ligase II
MRQLLSNQRSLWDLVAAAGLPARRFIADANGKMELAQLDGGTTLDIDLEACRDRAVVIFVGQQRAAAVAAVELDGVARRIVLCPPDLSPEYLPFVIAKSEAQILLTDRADPVSVNDGTLSVSRCGLPVARTGLAPVREARSEWLLFTSGTTGEPKMLVHSLASLTGPLDDGPHVMRDAVWSTFYDIHRYGGLQILLRALVGGGSMILSESSETVAAFLQRAGDDGVTHISGTPSHWRRALMSNAAHRITPSYIRLSGEIVDQTILDALRQAYPSSEIGHAYASTEAGVAFDVRDGRAGFPARLIGDPHAKAEMRIQDGSLWIRSSRVAWGYADSNSALTGEDGFIDTGDMVVLRGDRYYFVGRREGIINVGGRKVHPEEVEAIINQHSGVQMSLVKARPSPITGAIVVADIVLKAGQSFDAIQHEILDYCRASLPAHKIPALLREVSSLDVSVSGKINRNA